MTHNPYLTQVSPPATEPLTLAETRLYLRIDGTDEDSVVDRLITSARRACEYYLRKSLITQSWKLTFDEYAPSVVELKRGPVQSVTSVKQITRDGVETVVSSGTYYLSAGNKKLVFDAAPISHLVEITYVAGYGANSDIPPPLRQGMLSHIARMFEHRDSMLPMDGITKSLYDDYRELGV